MEVKNNEGYFKDPYTFEDFSSDTPRINQCQVTDEGKFVWPRIRLSDGSEAKIVFRFFTAEEKQIYKEYRSHDGKRKASRKPKQETQSATTEPAEHKPVKHEVDYSGCAASKYSEETVAKSDKILGVSNICGVLYALVTVSGTNQIAYIPRSSITDEQMYALCNPEDMYVAD